MIPSVRGGGFPVCRFPLIGLLGDAAALGPTLLVDVCALGIGVLFGGVAARIGRVETRFELGVSPATQLRLDAELQRPPTLFDGNATSVGVPLQ